MLHAVGPETMAGDEHVIGRGYQLGLNSVSGIVPIGVAYFAEMKWAIAVGLTILLPMVNELGGRVHDLCIRLRRTNILVRDGIRQASD